MRRDLPALDDDLSQGRLGNATGWLRERVQRHGGRFSPEEVITQACGTRPTSKPLMAYLEDKFGALSKG